MMAVRRFKLLISAAIFLVSFMVAGCWVMTDIGGDTDRSLVAVCPADMNVAPLAGIELVGGVLPSESDVTYAWDFVEKPEASSAEPPQPRGAQVSRFVPDVVGVYTARLTVTGETGDSSSCEVNIEVANREGLHVELYWNAPESPEGDPALDPHDSEGFGPEIINVPLPVAGDTYTVGVHYYQGNGLDEADIFVRIFCGAGSTSPAFEAGPMRMRDYGGGTDGNDFWKAAGVTWEGGTCSVAPIDEMVLALAAMYER